MPENANKPLRGRTILVACSASKMVELTARLEEAGGRVLPFPVIEVREMEDHGMLDRALAQLEEYAWIIFTSGHAVAFFMRRLNERKPAAARMPKICAIGPATARAVAGFGCEVALVPERFVAEGIVEALDKYAGGLGSLAGQRILIPRALEGREVIPEALAAAGALVDVVPCYRTVRAGLDEDAAWRIRQAKIDMIVFTSSSAVRGMMDSLGREDAQKLLLGSAVAVLGPVTGKTVEDFGKRAEIIPRASTIEALAREICSYYGTPG